MGCEAISAGSATTSDGRTRVNWSTPSGIRWKRVIGAPESVVGTAATGSPSAPPIAFAESITRPPPSATSGRPATCGPDGARSLRHRSGRDVRDDVGTLSTSSGAAPAARSVVSSA